MRLFELNNLQPFDVTNTDMPTYNDMMHNPEYFRNIKHVTFKIEWMSPTEYIKRVEDGFASFGKRRDIRAQRNSKLYKKYAKLMQQGTIFPMPMIHYRNDDFGQEGLHRAMAAEIADVKTMPVMIVRSIPKKNITEGISSIIYHFTRGPKAALSILEQNQFRLTASPGTDTERYLQKGRRQYYLSTARHKLGGYHIKSAGNGIIFNLDGEKLSQNYTGKAVSYWGPEYYGAPGSHKKGYEEKEAEDRIYSYKPFIPDAIKYIREIHVLFDINTEYGKPSGPIYRRLIITAKRLGIPIYVYENNRDWLIQNKNKAANPSKIDALAKAPSKEHDQKRLYSQKYKIYLGVWIELYMTPVNSPLSSGAEKLKREVLYGYGDQHRSLSAAIHNEKSKPADETGLETLLKIFRKEKITSSQQYVDLLKDKWTPNET